jgi:beta-aspartyl-dipeptidase (metallo-type)
VLLAGDRILKVGTIPRRAVEALGVDCTVIDARGGYVTPGLLDPHEHLLGGSGERGFGSQTPEISLGEIVAGGITTVVGCLGVDTTTKTMAGLLARAKGLTANGITAFIYSGGYDVPPATLLGSVREDILYVAEVIGAGEIAIADERALEPSPTELAKLVSAAHAGGLLSGKAGVTHFHVGPAARRLAPLRTLLDEYDVNPAWIYPTHVERSEELMREAIALTHRGCTVDIDVVERDLPQWLKFYRAGGGHPERLTVSTDAAITSPANLLDQIRACVWDHGFPLAEVLPLVTTNTARVLRLSGKGRLEAGRDADVLVLNRDGLAAREVIARGRRLVVDGRLVAAEAWQEGSDRAPRPTGRRSGG